MAFILYYYGISQGTIGSWFGKNKSTICRWLEDISRLASAYLKNLVVDFSGKIAIDEKWIKIGDVWFYLFVAVDCVSGYPLLAQIYESNSTNYCKLFLLELKSKGYIPKIIITDGWDSYIKAIKTVFPNAEHLLCRFHVIRSLFRRLQKAKIFNKEIYKLIGNIFKTDYKKTVRRRISKIKEKLAPLVTVKVIMGGLDKKLPQVIKAVGNKNKPSTSNAAETFFSRFDRFYKAKRGYFCDKESAQKHLNLFLLGYIFAIGAKGQACPLEKTDANVIQLPIYHLVNRPNIIMLKERMAQYYKEIA